MTFFDNIWTSEIENQTMIKISRDVIPVFTALVAAIN